MEFSTFPSALENCSGEPNDSPIWPRAAWQAIQEVIKETA
jgi:hypothetical protein